MNRFLALTVIGCAVLGLAGCPSKPVKDGDGGASVEGRGGAGAAGTTTHGTDGAGTFKGSPLDNPNSPLSVRVFYFDYDSSEVRAEFRESIQAHAAYLAQNPKTVVSLEGHTDERGSREYNLALGERRANAVRRQLVLLGASADQIRAVSYGEERAVSDGHDEQAWAMNRRVEIVY
ncbi:MAG: peptidoglycan-associated lipoprotein Pal [Gammaproteobacteria bacterium]